MSESCYKRGDRIECQRKPNLLNISFDVTRAICDAPPHIIAKPCRERHHHVTLNVFFRCARDTHKLSARRQGRKLRNICDAVKGYTGERKVLGF